MSSPQFLSSEEGILINLLQLTALGSKKGAAFPTILGIAAIIFALDQATKFLIVQNIPMHGSWSFAPAFARLFKFTFITNTGAAFGMFPQLGGAFMIVAMVVIVAIVIFYHHLPAEKFWVRVSLGLQLGGAMGNLLDRILRGYVVDFVDIGFWPIFNIADLSIVLGVTLLAYYLWHEENSAGQFEPGSRLSEGGSL